MATKVQKKSSIQDKIRPIGEVERYLTMLCYGQAGKGKTVFACSFPKPLLLLDIREEGQDSVTDVEGVDLLSIENWAELEEAYWMLESGSKYQSVVIDQLTAMQALGMQKIKEDKNMKPTEPFSQRSWGELSGLMQTWIYNFRELKKKELHICMNAHEKLKEPQAEDDDRIAPSVGSNLMGSVASFVNGAVSVIGNSFVRENHDKKTKQTTYEFCMRIGPHAYYAAKIRRPVSAGPAPDVIVNPTFDKVMKISKGGELVRKVKRDKE